MLRGILFVTSLAFAGEYLDLPQGRSPSPSPNGVYFVSGNCYALATFVPNAGVNGFADQFGKQWSNYRMLQTGNATIAGQAATPR